MAQAAQVLDTQSPLTQSSTQFLAHKVAPAETLSKIIVNYYGAAYGSPQYRQALTLLQYSNPEIKDINKIYPGQIIRLFDLTPGELAYCPKPAAVTDTSEQVRVDKVTEAEIEAWLNTNALQLPQFANFKHYWPNLPQEQDAFHTLAWLEQNYGIISTSAAAGLNTFGGVVSRGNQSFMIEVKSLW